MCGPEGIYAELLTGRIEKPHVDNIINYAKWHISPQYINKDPRRIQVITEEF